MKNQPFKPLLIGLAGPSCSGKTTLANELANALGRTTVTIVSLDSYYRDVTTLTGVEKAMWHYDLPEALDRGLLNSHLRSLADGQPIDKPVYLFPSHTRSMLTEHITPSPIIIFEGIYTLFWRDLRDWFGHRIFLDAPLELCLNRRLTRDPAERGVTTDEVLRQWRDEVLPFHRRFVLPTQRWSDQTIEAADSLSTLTENVILFIKKAGKLII